MKKTILIALLFLATGCGTTARMTDSRTNERIQIGMSLTEFRKSVGRDAKMHEVTADQTVYRVDDPWSGPQWVFRVKLFYFDKSDRLVRMETRDLQAPAPIAPVELDL
jgi:hypothetical protein